MLTLIISIIGLVVGFFVGSYLEYRDGKKEIAKLEERPYNQGETISELNTANSVLKWENGEYKERHDKVFGCVKDMEKVLVKGLN